MRRYTEVQEKVESLHNLLQIVTALRSLAAVRLQEARGTLAGVRTYAENITASLGRARQLAPAAEGRQSSGAATLLIVFLSEHGFVGNLNAKVVELAAGQRAVGRLDRIIAVGSRGASLALEQGLDLHATFAAPSHASGALPLARSLTDHVYECLASGAIGRLLLCYPRPVYDAQWEPAVRTLLPFPEMAAASESAALPPLMQMPRERLLPALIDEWLFAEIMRAEMEAFAAENAARLMTMEAMHANVTDKADGLEQQARMLRQDDITTELLDILVGAESALASRLQDQRHD